MTPELLGAIGEILGAAAVVVSLFYVGRQVKESSKATRGQTYQSLIQFNGVIASNVVLDESFGEIARKVFANEELKEGQYYRYQAQFLMILRLAESAYYQYSLGLIDEAQLRSLTASVSVHMRTDAGQRVWNEIKDNRSEEFRIFVDSLSQENT